MTDHSFLACTRFFIASNRLFILTLLSLDSASSSGVQPGVVPEDTRGKKNNQLFQVKKEDNQMVEDFPALQVGRAEACLSFGNETVGVTGEEGLMVFSRPIPFGAPAEYVLKSFSLPNDMRSSPPPSCSSISFMEVNHKNLQTSHERVFLLFLQLLFLLRRLRLSLLIAFRDRQQKPQLLPLQSKVVSWLTGCFASDIQNRNLIDFALHCGPE